MSGRPGVPGVAGVRGIGTDAVDIVRFRAVLARRPSLAGRLFSPGELARARRRGDPVPSLAARFAAKEAVLKALGVGLGAVDWCDVQVQAGESGAPVLDLRGRAARLAAEAGVDRWHVSLSHTDTLAIATVVAEGGATAVAESGATAVAEGGVGAGDGEAACCRS